MAELKIQPTDARHAELKRLLALSDNERKVAFPERIAVRLSENDVLLCKYRGQFAWGQCKGEYSAELRASQAGEDISIQPVPQEQRYLRVDWIRNIYRTNQYKDDFTTNYEDFLGIAAVEESLVDKLFGEVTGAKIQLPS